MDRSILHRIGAALLLALALPAVSHAQTLHAKLISYEEVPAVSSRGTGRFTADINDNRQTIRYELTYQDLEGTVQQAHIHFAQPGVNGGIVVFLCSNLPNPPTATPACPTPGGTVTGTIAADNVIGGAAAQLLSSGEFDELVTAMRAGLTYANVHSSLVPAGEIRGQIR